ncbi:MAG TPA: TonB-dependent receptor [Blastocatellia bacterium]|nr:TonB-dependent receptor [Blastocatellia bacterium]
MKRTGFRFAGALSLLVVIALAVAARPATAQQAQGKLVGSVGDVRSGELIRQAEIQIAGVSKKVMTGVDGDYSVELPAGTYDIVVSFHGYISQSFEKVEITAGETTQIDAVLTPVGYGEVVDVVAGAGGDVVAALEERKTATTISDSISRTEIANDTASTAAGVLERVPGVTTNDDYVYVRGLGERYSNTLVNNAMIPSPQPDRKAIPMDLIPSNLLQDVKILKTFTPDQPGEFSGGLVRLDTIEMPKNTTLSASYSMGFNSQTQGKPYLSYPGGSLDYFGFGVGDRALPDIIPVNERVVRGNIFVPGGFTPTELQTFGQAFNNVWSPTTEEGARPEQTLNLSGGTTWKRFGIVAAIGTKNVPNTQTEERNYYQIDSGGELTPTSSYVYNVSEELARFGTALNLSYNISTNHSISFKNLFTNQSTDEARIFQGPNSDRGSVLRNQRIEYTNERIFSSQLSGNSLFPQFGDLVVNYRYTYARSRLDQPDLREALYEQNPITGDFNYLDQNQSLFRLFSQMRENVREPGIDISRYWFLSKVSFNVKFGGLYSNRDRSFNSRRFRFTPRGLTGIDLTSSPEELLVDENISPDRGFELREETRNTDAYVAKQDITAGYLMGDITYGRWRFLGGVRVERSLQKVTTFEPFTESSPVETANLDNTDWLPGIGVVFSLTQTMNIRGGYSRTVSRPQFRELSPFEFTDVTGGRSVVGNPDLVRTLITNYDLRYEWYPATNEVFAVSYFYKHFDDPIETVIEPGAVSRSSFRNAESAKDQGIEFELRKGLGFIWDRLDNLSVNFNYTYVKSSVQLGAQDLVINTTTNRPLVGQSQNVVNAILVYEIPKWLFDARAFFNYQGERITDVGSLGLPDIYEKGWPSFDMRFSKKLGGERKPWAIDFELQNILNRQHDQRQGGLPYRVYRSGRDFTVGVSYNFY